MAVVSMGGGSAVTVTSHGILVGRLKRNGRLLYMLMMIVRSLLICKIRSFQTLEASVICFARMTTFH
jgi:hypothetical protein